MKKYIFTALLLSNLAFSQISVEDFSKKLNAEKVEFFLPMSSKEKVNLTLHKRKNSFSEKGIQSFVAYENEHFVGVVSVFKNQISGEIVHNGKNYTIFSEKGNIQISETNQTEHCKTCEGVCGVSHSEEEHHSQTSALVRNSTQISALNTFNPDQIDDFPEIYTDGVLRVYRVALLVDYSSFVADFGSNISKVKTFWSNAETFLNEVYMRDIGVKMVVLNDERLIRQSADQEVFNTSERSGREPSSYINTNSTSRIDKIINTKDYDIGATICIISESLGGLADRFMAYKSQKKAAVWARPRPMVLAHEFGHMFGSLHTFSEGGKGTYKSEPKRGLSVMSYNSAVPRDYFSMVSVYYIRRMMMNYPAYYSDKNRTQIELGRRPNINPVYGVKTENRPPVIDRKFLKTEYRLPRNSYFQFDIKASDPDGNRLLYAVHQADIETQGTTKARFPSPKPTTDSYFLFAPKYIDHGSFVERNNENALMDYDPARDYTFWIGVSDGADALATFSAENFATRYDMVQTKVKVENGTAFRFADNSVKNSYSANEKITLKWNVDTNIFPNDSRVKISLSDDFGKSWKYVLLASTENDGEAEITLPNIEIGEKTMAGTPHGLGIFKIEVLDHIAVAFSELNPAIGGFTISKSKINFQNLPEQFVSVKENNLPQIPSVTATSSCSGNTENVAVSFSEKINGNILERTWSATDKCSQTAYFTQFIVKEKVVEPLKFNQLPPDLHMSCYKDLPPAENLSVSGGSHPEVKFTQTRLTLNDNGLGYLLKRTWVATDPDAQSIMHTQNIMVYDAVVPTFSPYPQDLVVKSWADVPKIPDVKATDNCDGNLSVQTYQGYKDDDSQGRSRMYYSWFARDSAGNEAYHEQIITIDPTLSTAEQAKAESIKLYPNPANDSFQLNIENPKSVKIFDVSGKLVKTFGKQTKYNISDLPKGVFIVVVETDKGNEHLKLIKN